MKPSRRAVITAAALCIVTCAAHSAYAQWPQFRGPNGSGVASGTGYPVTFSPSANVVWKATVPFGQSSPVVSDGRVYLTASDAGRLITVALDAATGRELWRRDITPPRTQKIYKANDPASPTPVADEDGVIVFFPDFGLAAYAKDGKDRWTLPLGPFKSFYGLAASPIVTDDAVILVCDQQTGSFMVAADRKTGRVKWRKDRPGAVDGYATPMIFRAGSGPPQLVVLGTSQLQAYDPATGEERWALPIGSSGSMGTAVASGNTLFIATEGATEPWLPGFDTVLQKHDADKDGRASAKEMSAAKDMGEHFGFFDHDADGFITLQEWNTMRNFGIGNFGAIAIRPLETRGTLDPKSVAWRFQKNLPYIPAPLLYQDVFYMVKDGGIITALDAESGKLLKEGRSPDAIGQYFASPVAADGKLFLANTAGKITVLKAGRQWEVLGVNEVGDEVHATPALSDGRIYVRTRGALYAFGTKTPD